MKKKQANSAVLEIWDFPKWKLISIMPHELENMLDVLFITYVIYAHKHNLYNVHNYFCHNNYMRVKNVKNINNDKTICPSSFSLFVIFIYHANELELHEKKSQKVITWNWWEKQMHTFFLSLSLIWIINILLYFSS